MLSTYPKEAITRELNESSCWPFSKEMILSPTKKNKTDSARKKKRRTTSSSRSRKRGFLFRSQLSEEIRCIRVKDSCDREAFLGNLENQCWVQSAPTLIILFEPILYYWIICAPYSERNNPQRTSFKRLLSSNGRAFQVSWCTHDHCRGVK